MSTSEYKFGNTIIGANRSVFVIAEMSANHNHDFDQAVQILHAATEAGADAVKLQTYTPDTMTIECDNDYFKIGKGTIWEGRNLYDLYKDACTPWEWQPKLKKLADELGINLFSTAFDFSSVDFLEELGVAVHKVASFEIVDIPLIEKIARTGKPMIISTGMATLEEIREAVEAARGAGADQIALLKCTSAYPAPPEEMNLQAIPFLMKEFGVPMGLSDHTLGASVAVAAVALGACIVEKHFTLSRSFPGPDSAFSMEPDEFAEMVRSIRTVEKALGTTSFGAKETEKHSIVFRRSLFVVEDLKTDDVLNDKNVRSIRPGYGLPPKYLKDVLGRKVIRDVPRGTPLSWDLLGNENNSPES